MTSIDELYEEVRRRVRRLSPTEASRAQTRGALLVDLRPTEQRDAEGALPGAVVVSRHIMEWRLDPRSDHRLPGVQDHDQEIVLFCSEGYASVLAVEMLERLGLRNVADIDGGYAAWAAAGLPVKPPCDVGD